jgi:hypothetical protein
MSGLIKRLSKLTIVVLMAAMVSCIYIPTESVPLSTALGEMVTGARTSHINLVNRHFDLVEKNIDEFALGEYKEAFLANVRKLLKERDPDFIELTPEQYDKTIMRILKNRQKWINAVRSDRQSLLRSLEDYYSTMIEVNASITSLLSSAAGLGEARNELLDVFGTEVRAKALEIETKLLKSSEKVEDMLGAAIGKLIGG